MADHTYDAQPRVTATTTGAATLCIAATCWAIAVTQMRGMDMGVDTTLGSFGFFVGVWVAMMAAMMLPGAIPAVVSYARTHRHVSATTLFVAAYLAVWTLFGIAAYAVHRPHGTTAAGVITIAAGLYELTPTKQRARRRCQQPTRSGLHLGVHCMRSSIGLMVLLLALGAMSIAWMAAITALVVVQKLIPPRRTVDVALALALVGFGIATIAL